MSGVTSHAAEGHPCGSLNAANIRLRWIIREFSSSGYDHTSSY